MNALRDPWWRSVVVAATITVSGFVALVIGATGVRGSLSVPEQVSFAMSGGVGGAALAGAGLALLDIQRRRYESARERQQLASLARELGAIAELVGRRRGRPSPPPEDRRPRTRRTLRAR